MPGEAVTGRALEKRWPGGVPAIDGVDVTIGKGAITAIVGPNGAGKTTLLGLLAGVLAPTSGELELCGVKRPSARALAKLQSRLSYVDQDPALDPEMTGEETLRLMGTLYRLPRARVHAAAAELAARFSLGELLRRPVATWSGGQKRRLHLACALLHSPEIIFLDEPTAGLDAESARALWAELDERARSGAAVIVVGHDLDEIAREAARVILLERGKILADGSPAQLVEAHARTWLRVILREAPDEKIVERANALAGFSRATLDGRRLWVQAEDATRIGELMAALAVEIAEIAVHERDLASVYRTLRRS